MDQNNDPLGLNVDLANHAASRPVLPDGQYSGILANATVVPSKANPANRNLLISVKTTEDQTSTKGTVLKAGYELKRWLPLQASEKQIEAGMGDAWKDGLANLVDGIFGTSAADRPNINQETITAMTGKAVVFVSKIRSDETYGDNNDLGRITAAE